MFVDEQGNEQPDINNPKDGNKFGNSNPHTEPAPGVVEEPKVEEPKKPKKESKKVEVKEEKSSK
jgi:hypothetical protein